MAGTATFWPVTSVCNTITSINWCLLRLVPNHNMKNNNAHYQQLSHTQASICNNKLNKIFAYYKSSSPTNTRSSNNQHTPDIITIQETKLTTTFKTPKNIILHTHIPVYPHIHHLTIHSLYISLYLHHLAMTRHSLSSSHLLIWIIKQEQYNHITSIINNTSKLHQQKKMLTDQLQDSKQDKVYRRNQRNISNLNR